MMELEFHHTRGRQFSRPSFLTLCVVTQAAGGSLEELSSTLCCSSDSVQNHGQKLLRKLPNVENVKFIGNT